MRIELGKFACAGIETHLGGDIPAAVQTALAHYARKLKAGRGPLALPSFLADQDPLDPRVDFDLEVDAALEAVLDQEARRQGTTPTRLASHTVMVYLAELEFLGISPRPSVGTAPRL